MYLAFTAALVVICNYHSLRRGRNGLFLLIGLNKGLIDQIRSVSIIIRSVIAFFCSIKFDCSQGVCVFPGLFLLRLCVFFFLCAFFCAVIGVVSLTDLSLVVCSAVCLYFSSCPCLFLGSVLFVCFVVWGWSLFPYWRLIAVCVSVFLFYDSLGTVASVFSYWFQASVVFIASVLFCSSTVVGGFPSVSSTFFSLRPLLCLCVSVLLC